MTNIITFPGLGDLTFKINPTALQITENIKVAWYGIFIVVGMILAVIYASRRAKQEGVDSDDIIDLAIFAVIFGIIGARLYYVLTSLDEFSSFYEAIAIWEGGLAIYGGVIGGIAAIIGTSIYKKINPLKFLDIAAPAAMIGQMLGRFGNFTNAEAYGTLESFEFLGRKIATPGFENFFLRMQLGKMSESGYSYTIGVFHPTFIYEVIWNLLGFVLINLLYRKKKYHGKVLLMYLTWYGFGRMFIEGLRTDSLYIGSIRISQLLALLCFVVGGILLIIFGIRDRHAEPVLAIEERARAEAFAKFEAENDADADADGDGEDKSEGENKDGENN